MSFVHIRRPTEIESYQTDPMQDTIEHQGKIIRDQNREIILLKAKIFKLTELLHRPKTLRSIPEQCSGVSRSLLEGRL